ncbi:MAG: type II toxin-antitoxin system VapB family antitoxin [Elusimicrobiota bacterium]|nr:type II toxin-antitoxin system VapB family antitoxin [Elusimicrobiota bacterium]
MKTNIDLDEQLMNEAMAISGISTKKSVIDMLLAEYVKKNNQKQILKYQGANIWDGNLDDMRAER